MASKRQTSADSFEELWVWQQARALVRHVYSDFSDRSSGRTDFSFRNQIQRAAISVMNNIAEGHERQTDSEFARFIDIARASCGEVRSMYYAAEDLQYVTVEIANDRRNMMRQISAGLWKLAKHLRT